MIMLRRVGDFENDRDLRIKKLDTEFGKVVLGIEDQPVSSARKRFFNQKEWFHPAVFVGPGMTQLRPCFVRVLDVQMDRNAARRRTARYVEDVRRDGAHNESGVYSLKSSLNNKNVH